MAYVYWIYDTTCSTVGVSGYVGVTNHLLNRYKSHKRRFGDHVSVAQLYEGSRIECFEIERGLRPKSGIGWNQAIGGAQGYSQGFVHSANTRKKMKDAWTEERKKKASVIRKTQNAKQIGQKRPAQSVAMKGSNNPMLGTTRPEHVKEAVARVHRGKPAPNRQELYCVGCRQRASLSVLKKYHGKCQ